MLKVLTIVGTRPELIKMSRVISEFDQHTHHILVHTGQNHDYELNQIFFRDLAIRAPNYFLSAAGKNAAETISKVIVKADAVLSREKPDAVLIYGDTNSGLAALSAKRRRIPIFHMEAGNRCRDQRVPEEINRKILDHISDINLVLTEHARRNLLEEGIPAETIFKTGSHMPEVFQASEDGIQKSKILEHLGLSPQGYFLVSAHREENVDALENMENLLGILRALASAHKKPVVVSTHPRTRVRLRASGKKLNHPLVRFHKPFGFLDYMKLQTHAFCVLSDSGGLTEEVDYWDFPAVMIRNVHERPEGQDAGCVIMAGLEPKRVLEAVKITLSQRRGETPNSRRIPDYAATDVSGKILKIVLGYTGYVKRTVWRENGCQ